MSVTRETISIEPRNTRGWPKNKQQLEFALRVVQYGDSIPQAALNAGYSKGYARSSSHVLAKSLRPFLAFLQERKNELAAKKYDVTNEVVLRHMASIGLQNPKDYVSILEVNGVEREIGKPLRELTDLQAVAVKSWTVEEIQTDDGVVLNYKYQLYDKDNALVQLGRHLGMFSEKLMLDLNLRKSKAEAIDFSALPQERLGQVIEFLQLVQEDAAKARAIEGESKVLDS